MAMLNSIRNTRRVNSANNPVWMDALRIVLGLFLFLKGILFLQHNTDVFHFINSGAEVYTAGKAHLLISLVHIAGGLMITFGFLTRLALLCQFPIIIGTLLVVSPKRGSSVSVEELILSLLIVGLLLFFMIVGPGRYSVDNKVLRQKGAKPLA